MSYSPAPTPRPKLGWDGQTRLVVPKDGLEIVTGAGVIGRTDAAGGRLLLDAERADPAEVTCLFSPGVVAARTIGKWRNRRVSQRAYLAALEANLATAPTAGDAANGWRLKVTDGAGGTALLPISTAAETFYGLDQGDGTELVRPFPVIPDPATNSTSLGGGSGGLLGRAFAFVPSQALVITGLSALLKTGSGTADFGLQARGALLDASKVELAAGYGSTISAQVRRVRFPFPLAIPLTAGETYFFAFDIFQTAYLAPGADAGGASTPALYYYTGAAGSQAIPGTQPAVGVRVETQKALDAPVPFEWVNFGDPVLPNTPETRFADQPWGTGLGDVTAFGSPSGAAPLVGDLTFALESFGVPPAGSEGADLNLRAVILP